MLSPIIYMYTVNIVRPQNSKINLKLKWYKLWKLCKLLNCKFSMFSERLQISVAVVIRFNRLWLLWKRVVNVFEAITLHEQIIIICMFWKSCLNLMKNKTIANILIILNIKLWSTFNIHRWFSMFRYGIHLHILAKSIHKNFLLH